MTHDLPITILLCFLQGGLDSQTASRDRGRQQEKRNFDAEIPSRPTTCPNILCYVLMLLHLVENEKRRAKHFSLRSKISCKWIYVNCQAKCKGAWFLHRQKRPKIRLALENSDKFFPEKLLKEWQCKILWKGNQ